MGRRRLGRNVGAARANRRRRAALALQVGHLSDFFLGNRNNLRGRVARALPAWSRDDPGYGFVLGMAAFGLEECGDYGAAEENARHAITLEPDDCWAQHALCHVMEMQARQHEGIAFMEGRQAHWAQEDNIFAFHNWWHVSLFYLDNDRFDRVLEIYDAAIRPESSEVQLEMLDAASLLWRLRLREIDTGDRFEKLAATYEALAEHGFYAFNDMHAMVAYVATGRDEAAHALESAAAAVAEGTATNARMTRDVGLPIVRAIRAFGAERYGETVELLMPVRYRAQAFGGSHARRDIVHRTLIEARDTRRPARPLTGAGERAHGVEAALPLQLVAQRARQGDGEPRLIPNRALCVELALRRINVTPGAAADVNAVSRAKPGMVEHRNVTGHVLELSPLSICSRDMGEGRGRYLRG